MSILQVKNVPTHLAKKVKRLAMAENRSLSDIVLRALEREVQRHEFSAQLKRRRPVNLEQKAADILAEVRAEREP